MTALLIIITAVALFWIGVCVGATVMPCRIYGTTRDDTLDTIEAAILARLDALDMADDKSDAPGLYAALGILADVADNLE